MTDLQEVRVENLEDEGEESARPTGEGPPTSPRKKRRSRKRRKSSDSDAPVQSLQSGQDPDPEGKSENVSGERGAKPVDSQKPDPPPTEEDYRTKFYELYRHEAEEYDREFIKRYDEDLNTTLIFAGLFSAVTSAFIIQVQPQLQSDPNEETAALLRVLIHKIDNTTFGGDTPTVPQWSGPPRTIIQVQAILYTSLAASLFSAFLAMLGKQWLNRYASIDMRGSTIERSQNRQRKLDGIVAWYFDYVMESLPLMLQFALLLLGSALSRYLWEVNTTIASVVLGVTSFGVASYVFFVVAGAAFVSCPYQIPGARILRRISPFALGVLRALSRSEFLSMLFGSLNDLKYPRHSIGNIAVTAIAILLSPIILLGALVVDTFLLTRAVARWSVVNALRVYGWFHRARGRDPQVATLDLQCISWMLQTSLDKTIHLLTLKLLAMMTTLTKFDSALVSACFDILAGCVSSIGGKIAIIQGSEELTAVSTLCCLRALSHLTTMDPASRAFEDIRRRYTKSFPIETNFEGSPSYHRFCMIHNIFHPSHKQAQSLISHWDARRPKIQWRDYKLSSAEHVILVKFAKFEYQRKQRQKVPRWIVRFGHHLLSQDPLLPTPVIADCLSIIAVDLGCTVLNTATLDESARLEAVLNLLTEELENMAQIKDLDRIWSKRKTLVALFPYVVWQDRYGSHRMVDAFLGITRAPNIGMFMAEPITTLFAETGSNSPIRVVSLLSPYANWDTWRLDGSTVALWAAAALAIPYTEEVGQSVIAALLQIATVYHLEQYVPAEIWAWLKRQPSLPPICRGRSVGTRDNVVRRVRELGDVEILESYFLLVWSEWDYVDWHGLRGMFTSIREDFNGIGMGRNREVLVKRLDHVLGELAKGLGHLKQQEPSLDEYHIPTAREDYKRLKDVLLEVDREALEILTRTPFRLYNSFNLLTPADIHRMPLEVRLCAPSSVSVVARPQHLLFVLPTPCFFRAWVSSSCPFELYRCPALQPGGVSCMS